MEFYSCFCRTCQLQLLTESECHSCTCGTYIYLRRRVWQSRTLHAQHAATGVTSRKDTRLYRYAASLVYVHQVLDGYLLTFHFMSSVPFDVWKINYRHVASSVYLTACNHVYATKCIARAISAGRQRLSFD